MKAGGDFFSKSSFLSVEKDFAIIVKKLMTNQRLLKLLYYSQKDCLKAPDLTDEQILSMINKQIKIVPDLPIDEVCPTYIIIAFDNFSPNRQNPLFRDCTVECSIFCHPDHWLLPDFQVRPFKIAGEIDSMLNENKFSGIGTLQFQNGTQLTMNRNMLGFALQYKAIHGIDDKIEG